MITDYNELLGQALGTCTLQRLLGRGGMGAVYLAQQSRPRRTVAVKVLMPSNVLENKSRVEFLTRFRREADAIAALDHVNIMPIYEYGEQGEIAFLVMPYVNGGTLRDVLAQRGILSLDEVVYIIEQAAAALDTAHAQGIIHRDLKPGNMLFHADGRLLLADFGLAKVLRDLKDPQSGHLDLTSTGTIVGTPEYLSPEQGTGRPIDHRSDIYSLGIVLFHMLSGHVPFTGTSPVAVAIKHALEEPPSLTQLNPKIPPEIEAVVMTTLAKEPGDRYNSAGELAEALRIAVYGQNAPPTPSYFSVKTLAVRPEPVQTTEHPPASGSPVHDALTEAAAPVVPEPLQISPTLSVDSTQDKDPNFHGSATEAAPRILSQQTEETIPTFTLSDEANVIRTPAVSDSNMETLVTTKSTTSKKPEQQKPRAVQARGCQSISMMLLGSVLTLLVVVGLFATYLIYVAPGQNNKQTQAQAKQTATSTATTSSKPVQKGVLNLPEPAIPAGALLYGTDLPGTSCDTRGGKWHNSGTVQEKCQNNTTVLSNTGGGAAGIYLDKLPNQPLPSSYIIQVQINANVSRGAFDIYFFNQSGSQGWDRCQIDPRAGSFRFDEYRDGATTSFYGNTLQKGPMHGIVTVNIQIQGNTYYLYTNKAQEGYVNSGNYTSGGIGLGVESGAQVSLKNFAIYALS